MLATVTAPSSNRTEAGTRFWVKLSEECERQINAINTVLKDHGDDPEQWLHWTAGDDIRISACSGPATRIYSRLGFRSWGPVINATMDCYEADGTRLTEEIEVPIAVDGDGEIVGLFDQGRSISPCELAAYLIQHFRHCFPAVSLPCPDSSAFAH